MVVNYFDQTESHARLPSRAWEQLAWHFQLPVEPNFDLAFSKRHHHEGVAQTGCSDTAARQNFQILAMLLERPGELIAREELQNRLWPNGTFVDFEKGLNTAVKKLRVALGDSAETPLFMEFLPVAATPFRTY